MFESSRTMFEAIEERRNAGREMERHCLVYVITEPMSLSKSNSADAGHRLPTGVFSGKEGDDDVCSSAISSRMAIGLAASTTVFRLRNREKRRVVSFPSAVSPSAMRMMTEELWETYEAEYWA